MKPQISVLIPVYSAEKYLPKCLASLLAQRYTDFEIVCIDDGSQDKSFDILNEYAAQDKRLRVLRQKNAGVAATRNRLLQEARGKYIAFVDADDWVDPNYLSLLYKTAQQHQADVVRCQFWVVDQTTGEVTACDKCYRDYAARRQEPQTLPERFQAGQDDSQVWGKLISTELIREAKIDFCAGCVAEDVSFEVLLYLHAKHICFLSKYLYYYRVSLPYSITSNRANMARGVLLNLCFLSEDLARRGFDVPELYGSLLRLLVKAIRRFRYFKMSGEDMKICQRALALIEKHRSRCYFWARWRYGWFVRLSRNKPLKQMIFWSRILR